VGSDGKSYGSPKQEYAASEIDHFSTLHHGEFMEVYKAAGALKATESRNLGSPPDRDHEKLFPVYVRYSERSLSSVSGPDFGPNVLQFWAYTVGVDSFQFGDIEGTLITEPEHGNSPGKLVVNRLLDPKRKHCGLIFKPHVTALTAFQIA
jgi:hypothetical protein